MFEEYYFLFAVAILWTIFAVVQDIRKTEVANWLSFSLIAVCLAYRIFYSSFTGDWMFLLYGLIGFVGFYIVGMLLYYGGIFGGGDAKLLMGLGIVLPYHSFSGVGVEGLGFIIGLFVLGAIYSLIYSVFLVVKNKKRFKLEFYNKLSKARALSIVCLILIFVLLIRTVDVYSIALFIILIIFPFFYAYVMALDNCMVKLTNPGNLQEGDWILQDIKVGNKVIRKDAHGLSYKEIAILKKANRKVLIKHGIPFTPAFLLMLIAMVFFYLVLSQSFLKIFSF